jgi:hypothetical protein
VTKAPHWLDQHWRGEVLEPLLTGSLEERAERILKIARDEQGSLDRKKTLKPNMVKVLALDLAAAAAEQGQWLKPVERLLALALNLPEGHEAGRWLPLDLDRRGRHKPAEIEAWCAAHLIDSCCYQKYGKVKSQRALERELRDQGFKTAQRRIGEWRAKSYGCKPGSLGHVPPNAPTMSQEEECKVPPFVEWRITVTHPDEEPDE